MASPQARSVTEERKARILSEARDIFDEDAGSWLSSPNEHLGGRSPESTIEDGDWEDVWELLQRIKFIGVS